MSKGVPEAGQVRSGHIQSEVSQLESKRNHTTPKFSSQESASHSEAKEASCIGSPQMRPQILPNTSEATVSYKTDIAKSEFSPAIANAVAVNITTATTVNQTGTAEESETAVEAHLSTPPVIQNLNNNPKDNFTSGLTTNNIITTTTAAAILTTTSVSTTTTATCSATRSTDSGRRAPKITTLSLPRPRRGGPEERTTLSPSTSVATGERSIRGNPEKAISSLPTSVTTRESQRQGLIDCEVSPTPTPLRERRTTGKATARTLGTTKSSTSTKETSRRSRLEAVEVASSSSPASSDFTSPLQAMVILSPPSENGHVLPHQVGQSHDTPQNPSSLPTSPGAPSVRHGERLIEPVMASVAPPPLRDADALRRNEKIVSVHRGLNKQPVKRKLWDVDHEKLSKELKEESKKSEEEEIKRFKERYIVLPPIVNLNSPRFYWSQVITSDNRQLAVSSTSKATSSSSPSSVDIPGTSHTSSSIGNTNNTSAVTSKKTLEGSASCSEVKETLKSTEPSVTLKTGITESTGSAKEEVLLKVPAENKQEEVKDNSLPTSSGHGSNQQGQMKNLNPNTSETFTSILTSSLTLPTSSFYSQTPCSLSSSFSSSASPLSSSISSSASPLSSSASSLNLSTTSNSSSTSGVSSMESTPTNGGRLSLNSPQPSQQSETPASTITPLGEFETPSQGATPRSSRGRVVTTRESSSSTQRPTRTRLRRFSSTQIKGTGRLRKLPRI